MVSFDAGGAISGPMSSSFILPLILGICASRGNTYYDAFGCIALVALSPLITIQILGFIYNIKVKIDTQTNIDESIIRLDYIEKLSEELGNISYTYKDFINFFNKMIDDKEKIEYPLNKDIPNSVKIMTIHKSKGLEYPICYFPNLLSKFNTMDIKQKFFFDNEFGIVTPYIDDGIKPTIYKTLYKEKYLKEEIGEKIRLFYVALTRAKEKMIFVTSLKESIESDEVSIDTK